MKLIFSTLILASILLCLKANSYDPHVFPKQGPFFEGWYSRFIDYKSKNSFGLLFGQVLSKSKTFLGDDGKPAYMSVLHDKGDGSPMKYYDFFPNLNEIQVLDKDNQVITSDPKIDGTQVGFTYRIENVGFFTAHSDHTEFMFETDAVLIKGKVGKAVTWGPNGEGPAGWVDNLPLPLYWFVHSLESDIEYLEFQDKNTKEHVEVTEGTAHQEKNWGQAFPAAWIWIQSHNKELNTQFVMSGGPVDIIGDLSVQAHLVGFRSPTLNISFHPQDSWVSKDVDSCNGRFTTEIQNLQYKVKYESRADMQSFAGLLGPSETGFKLMCYESYQAKANVKVYKKSLLGDKLLQDVDFDGSALEFGGQFACEQKSF